MIYSRALTAFVLSILMALASARREKPIVLRPRRQRKYTTALTIDGGGMKDMISVMIVQEIEASIKRYLLSNRSLLPRKSNITSIDDFHVLLADFFDAMAGVSAGSWLTGYLASKGGNGAVAPVFADRRNIRRYDSIIPGEAKGLEVFFFEYGDNFYPGDVRFNVTPPTIMLRSAEIPDITNILNQDGPAQFLPGIEIPGVNAPFYPVEGLEAALEAFLGDVKLSELSTFYVVHAYDLIRRQNLYFVHDTVSQRRSFTFTSSAMSRNSPRPVDERANSNDQYIPDVNVESGVDFYLRDLLRGSSAIPSNHEAKVLTPVNDENTTYSLIDGAVITNNPSLQLYIFLTTSPRLIPVQDIAMISIGSGIQLQATEDNIDASLLGWMVNNELFSVMADGSAETTHSQVEFLFYGSPGVEPGQYLRIQVTAEANTTDGELLGGVTEYDNLRGLKRMGLRGAARYRESIDEFVEKFIFG